MGGRRVGQGAVACGGRSLCRARQARHVTPTSWGEPSGGAVSIDGDPKQSCFAACWGTISELSGLFDDLETGLAYFAFGQLCKHLTYHLITVTDRRHLRGETNSDCPRSEDHLIATVRA